MKMMREMKPIAAAICYLLACSACQKPSAQAPGPTEEPEAAKPVAVAPAAPETAPAPATPAPAVAMAPATPAPAPRELAPEGVFYLLTAARIETDSGVSGLPPGTGVKRLHDDVYLTPAGEAHLSADQLTNDMALARQARDADRVRQNAAQARIAADSALISARQKAETQNAPASVPVPASQPAATSAQAPKPTATPAWGTSLDTPTSSLNSTHSSTKDKVYHDDFGDYWKDIYGKKHYFTK